MGDALYFKINLSNIHIPNRPDNVVKMAKKGRFWPFLAQKSENPKFTHGTPKLFFSKSVVTSHI